MNTTNNPNFDFLDMNNYKLEKIPVKEKSNFEKKLIIVGVPLAILAFVLILFVVKIPFLDNLDPNVLSKSALKNFNTIGTENFIYANRAMLAIFVAAIILWITESIPNYLTSLMLIVALVLTHVVPEEEAYAQLGHDVMWLNIMSFVLASMLVTTGIAKRFALWFIIKFGKSASTVILSFLVINLVLSLFISATTAKAAILLPVFMVVAAIYGASNGNRNNAGRNILLQNLFQNNMGASSFLTGSGANLLAASLIAGAVGNDIFFSQWMIAALPLSLILMILGWWIGTKIIFPIKKSENLPLIEGGMDSLKKDLDALGKISITEIKSIFIFVGILLLWVTDKWHGISPTAVAFIGAIIALLPRVGIVKWNDVDIPWHLMMFSAGAYALGAGLKETDLPSIAVHHAFDAMGFTQNTPFAWLYIILTGAMVFSALFMQSKTMRAMIFIPIAIGIATKFNFPIMSLAFPLALLIEHVYTLPFNSKPAILLYSTNQYSMSDGFKFGITMQTIAWILSILMAMSYFKWLGITPNGLF